jgi:hypothetical protein
MSVNRKKIFVLGTGRSGTCWVGDILGEHPDVRSYVETRPLFDWVTQAAISTRDEQELLPLILAEYHRLFEESHPLHFADKSHPCIWIAEKLAKQFSDAYFVGVVRDVEPTVASMLKHSGVRRWCEEWNRYEVPNRFLGITERNLNWYRLATILERCVARWYAHHNELARLEQVLTTRFIRLQYESLVLDTRTMLARLRDFLDLDSEFPTIVPLTSSLTKWEADLAPGDIAAIRSAIHFLANENSTADSNEMLAKTPAIHFDH